MTRPDKQARRDGKNACRNKNMSKRHVKYKRSAKLGEEVISRNKQGPICVCIWLYVSCREVRNGNLQSM